MKEIHIKNQIIKVDDEDYLYLTTCYDITINKQGYVQCSPKSKYKKHRMGLFSMTLHKLLFYPFKTGREINVDHIDGDKLNNQKQNFRLCTHQENMYNYNSKKGAIEYKGVTKHSPLGWYQVFISKEKKSYYFGLYSTKEAAANCYNYYAKEFHGEFARLNDVPYMKKEEWESCRVQKKTTSKYRGASKVNNKWVVQIWDGENKKNIIKRGFETEIDAAKAYNKLAIELKGDKAKLNNIEL